MASHVRPIEVSVADRAALARLERALSTPAGLSQRARAVLLMTQYSSGSMREDWHTMLFYKSPSLKWALLEWLRQQPTHLLGSQLAEAEVDEGCHGWSVISTATLTDNVGSHAKAWTGDVPLSPDSSCGYGSWEGTRSSVATEVTLTEAEGDKEGGGLPSHDLDVDCPVRGRSRGRFMAPPPRY